MDGLPMLAPDDRALLSDALRPPLGTRLERAVATTFTLDLATALTVPLAFAGHSISHDLDPVSLMEAVRGSADRLDIFAQAGVISAARWPSDLAVLLEQVVHEVPRPRPGHRFHPKTWVIRYGGQDGTEAYRLLVLSRNLTADRSWDLVVRLDGRLGRRINRDNEPLARFIRALVGMSKTALAEDRSDGILALADELRRVDWEPPEGARRVRFWALGLPGERPAKLDDLFVGYRHLVISPYITAEGIGAIIRPMAQGTDAVLISRAEELDRLPTGALDNLTVRVINQAAELSDEEDINAAPAAEQSRPIPFGALHAKAIIVEKNRVARAFFGSANATSAGLQGNIEFLCELEGAPSRLGVASMLDDADGFAKLLEDYVPPPVPVIDEVEEFGRRLDEYLVDAAQRSFVLTVSRADGKWAGDITTDRPLPMPPSETTVSLSPFNRPAERLAIVAGRAVQVQLAPRDSADLTPFLVLSIRGDVKGTSVERSTVVTAEIQGDPADRLEEILARQIDSPEKFLRLLLLLLGLADAAQMAQLLTSTGHGGRWRDGMTSGVFELLVRGLAADAAAFDRLDDIVRRLTARQDGASVLPPGWGALWPTFVKARRLTGRSS
jgi:hypothetical protein